MREKDNNTDGKILGFPAILCTEHWKTLQECAAVRLCNLWWFVRGKVIMTISSSITTTRKIPMHEQDIEPQCIATAWRTLYERHLPNPDSHEQCKRALCSQCHPCAHAADLHQPFCNQWFLRILCIPEQYGCRARGLFAGSWHLLKEEVKEVKVDCLFGTDFRVYRCQRGLRRPKTMQTDLHPWYCITATTRKNTWKSRTITRQARWCGAQCHA